MKKMVGRNGHFGYYRMATQIQVKGWGLVTLGEAIPVGLREAHEDALYGIKTLESK